DEPRQIEPTAVALRPIHRQSVLGGAQRGERRRAAMQARLALLFEAADQCLAAAPHRDWPAKSPGERASRNRVRRAHAKPFERAAAAAAERRRGARLFTEHAERLGVIENQLAAMALDGLQQ